MMKPENRNLTAINLQQVIILTHPSQQCCFDLTDDLWGGEGRKGSGVGWATSGRGSSRRPRSLRGGCRVWVWRPSHRPSAPLQVEVLTSTQTSVSDDINTNGYKTTSSIAMKSTIYDWTIELLQFAWLVYSVYIPCAVMYDKRMLMYKYL